MKKAAVLVFTLVVAAALVGCAKKIPLAGDQKAYAGKWIADDGAFIVIFPDGGAELRLTNKKLAGGRVTITAGSLIISLGPINTTFSINEGPKDAGGRWTMVLDGVKYTRQ